MTNNKAYNLKVFCDLKKTDPESEEANIFSEKTFYEQLVIIKEIKQYLNSSTPDRTESYSILDKILNTY